MNTGIEHFACHFTTEKRLAVGALNAQWQTALNGLIDLLLQLIAGVSILLAEV
jgi:hypothetical protein